MKIMAVQCSAMPVGAQQPPVHVSHTIHVLLRPPATHRLPAGWVCRWVPTDAAADIPTNAHNSSGAAAPLRLPPGCMALQSTIMNDEGH
jgi:hypothetical protein